MKNRVENVLIICFLSLSIFIFVQVLMFLITYYGIMFEGPQFTFIAK